MINCKYKDFDKTDINTKYDGIFLPHISLNLVDRNRFSLNKKLSIRWLKNFLKYVNKASVSCTSFNDNLNEEKL